MPKLIESKEILDDICVILLRPNDSIINPTNHLSYFYSHFNTDRTRANSHLVALHRFFREWMRHFDVRWSIGAMHWWYYSTVIQIHSTCRCSHGSLYQTSLYSDTNLTHRNCKCTIIDTNKIFFEINRTYFPIHKTLLEKTKNIFYNNLRTLSSHIHFMNKIFWNVTETCYQTWIFLLSILPILPIHQLYYTHDSHATAALTKYCWNR